MLLQILLQYLHAIPFLPGQMKGALEEVAFGSLRNAAITMQVTKPFSMFLIMEMLV